VININYFQLNVYCKFMFLLSQEEVLDKQDTASYIASIIWNTAYETCACKESSWILYLFIINYRVLYKVLPGILSTLTTKECRVFLSFYLTNYFITHMIINGYLTQCCPSLKPYYLIVSHINTYDYQVDRRKNCINFWAWRIVAPSST